MLRSRRIRNLKQCSGLVLDQRLKRIGGANCRTKIVGRYSLNLADALLYRPGHNAQLLLARGGTIKDYTLDTESQLGHWTLQVGSTEFDLIDTGSAALSNGAEPGDQTVAFSGTAPTPGQWYFLRDTKKKETNATSSFIRGIGGELVQVRSVSGSNVTFTAPLTQSYPAPDTDYDPRLSLLPSGVTVVENVLIKGFKFVGRTETGFNSWLRAGFCAGITLQDCSGQKSRLAGFSINYSRDVEVSRCTARDLITGAGSGSSYSIHLERCINAKVLQSKVINARYGVSIESGTSAWSVDGFFADGTTDGAVDIHGGDSYNGTVSNVSASGWPVSVGNTEWRRGASFVTYSAINCADLRLARLVHLPQVELAVSRVLVRA